MVIYQGHSSLCDRLYWVTRIPKASSFLFHPEFSIALTAPPDVDSNSLGSTFYLRKILHSTSKLNFTSEKNSYFSLFFIQNFSIEKYFLFLFDGWGLWPLSTRHAVNLLVSFKYIGIERICASASLWLLDSTPPPLRWTLKLVKDMWSWWVGAYWLYSTWWHHWSVS